MVVTVYGGSVLVHTPPEMVGTVHTLEKTNVGTGNVVENPGHVSTLGPVGDVWDVPPLVNTGPPNGPLGTGMDGGGKAGGGGLPAATGGEGGTKSGKTIAAEDGVNVSATAVRVVLRSVV